VNFFHSVINRIKTLLVTRQEIHIETLKFLFFKGFPTQDQEKIYTFLDQELESDLDYIFSDTESQSYLETVAGSVESL